MSVKKLTGKWLVAAWVGLAVILVAAVCVVFALVGRSVTTSQSAPGASGAESDPAAVPQSVAKTIQPQSAGPANTTGSMGTDADAGAQASYVMTTMWDAYADPEQAQATDLSSVLTESALEEFDAKALEWTTEGLYSEGTPTIENPQVIEDDGAGNVTVSVCVDSSSVRILNDAGTVLTDDTAMTRALTYLRFVKDGQNWKLAGYSFPDDPTC